MMKLWRPSRLLKRYCPAAPQTHALLRNRLNRLVRRLAILVLTPAVLSPAQALPSAAKTALHVLLVQPGVIEKRLEDPPYANIKRELALQTLFETAGCGRSQLSEQTVRRGDPPNLICDMRGKSPELIIVAGHLDHVRKGKGVVDDWSGASMLPSLYESLRSVPRKHTFLFIGFTDEEKGLVGSRFYVHHLSPARAAQVRAMVNLECLGMNPPVVWADHADPRLLASLRLVSRSLGLSLPTVNAEDYGSDDAESFRGRKLPTITIHSVTQDTLHILHSRDDNMAAIHMPYYYEAYQLVADYLATIDSTLN